MWSLSEFFKQFKRQKTLDYFDDDPELEHECTSWMVFSDLTGNNSNILHKNRDFKRYDISVYLSPENSRRKWIALGSDSKCNMGMNTSGLAGVMNSGELCINHSTDDTKKTTQEIMRVIIESCDTAAEAVEKLREIIASGDYWHRQKGSTFFFMDTNEGYICEFTPAFFTVQPYKSGYAVRANIWQNPGMQYHSRSSITACLNSSARTYIACSGLNKFLDEKGKIGVEDIMELSRHCTMPEESPEKRSLCYMRTNSAATFEIDRQYPGVLSSGYFSIGHPRNTIIVPIPVCTVKILDAMGDNSWSAAALKRLNELGYDAYIPEEWLEFERISMEKYSAARESARQYLDSGKPDRAVELLNAAAYHIWEEAAELLEI